MPDGRIVRFAITLAVMVAMALPAIRDVDSFPLSSYPMYSSVRPATERLASAVAIDEFGKFERLSLDLIARTDDPLIAQSFLRDAIRSERADTVCEEIAGRVGRSDRRTSLETVEVVTEEVDLVDFVSDDGGTIGRTVHASCEIER